MVARKRWLFRQRPPELQDVRDSITSAVGNRSRAALEKDLPYVELAMSADRRLVSMDEKARDEYTEVARSAPSIGRLMWANPEVPTDGTVEWLRRGAPVERTRYLA